MDKYELVERYEALGGEDDFLAARRLFEQELAEESSALDRRQYGYLLECHGRRALQRAVDQYELAMSLDPDQDKVCYQWMHAKAALGEPEDAISRYRNRLADSPGDVRAALAVHRLPHGPRLRRGQRHHRHRARAGARRLEADLRPG